MDKKRLLRLITSVGLALILVVAGSRPALAVTWYPNGHQLDGWTNPRDFMSNPGMNQTYYRAASFSRIYEYNYWVGVQNEAGDWCSGGGGGFPKQTSNWNWQINQPNIGHSAMTGWVLAQNCTTGHTYRVRGWHNIHGSDVDYYDTTEAP